MVKFSIIAPLPSSSINTTYNTILESISPIYSITFGDNILNKPNDVVWVFYQNTGRLKISTGSHKFEVMCGAMYENEVDIGCLVETNTHWQHKRIIPKINQVMRQFWSRNNIQTVETITPWTNIYKSDGSLMIFTTNLSSRIIHSGEDSEGIGGWSYVTYGGNNKLKVSIMSAYHPCAPNDNQGVFTVYS